MAFRKKKRSSGGGSGGSVFTNFGGIISTVFGCIMMLVCIIGFNIIIGQIDTAYTAAGAYAEQVSVQEVMGIIPLLVFVVIMMVGVAALGYGGYVSYKKASGGDFMGMIMGVISGVIGMIVAFIMFGIINSSLHNAYVVANATVNKAAFAGILDIMGIWGIVILVTLVFSSLAGFAGAGVAGYKKVKGAL